MSIVWINFYSKESPDGGGHACNGVILDNGQWVLVEPQNDRIYDKGYQQYIESFLRQTNVVIEEVGISW
jgi:hypothetical protein